MRYIQILLTLFIAALSTSCNPKTEDTAVNQFSGLWSLYIVEAQESETGAWSEWRNGLQGYLLYDDEDNMAVHLASKSYQDTDLRFPNFVDSISNEALKHLTNSYVYFAKYSFDKEKRVIEHARISHSNPGEWNEVVKRSYTFNGDTLTLQPLEEENAGLRLKWVKESELSR